MAHSLSAKKRIRQNEKQHKRNKARLTSIKTQVKKFLNLIHDKEVQAASDQLKVVNKKLDQVAAKGSIHPNNAARKKASFARRLNTLQQQVSQQG